MSFELVTSSWLGSSVREPPLKGVVALLQLSHLTDKERRV